MDERDDSGWWVLGFVAVCMLLAGLMLWYGLRAS